MKIIYSRSKMTKGMFFLCFFIFGGGKCFGQAGSLDQSFGKGGKVVSSFTSPWDHAYSVVIQTDGKLVVGARFQDGSNKPYDFGLARYKETGLVDSSFGNNGKVITDFFWKR